MSHNDLRALHDRLEPMIGRQGTPLRARISERHIRRFATACGETDPIYFSAAAAAAAGYPSVPAPLMLLTSVIEWDCGPELGALRPDGTGVGRENWLPLDGFRLMGGGQDNTFHAPVLAGMEVVGTPTLASVTLREGSSGTLVLIVVATEFRTSDGIDLVSCRETTIAR